MSQADEVTVALLGGGTVGAQVARLILENASDLAARVGAPLRLVGVAVRDRDRHREGIPDELLTTDAEALAASGADVVVELIGGVEPAGSLVATALDRGSSVVSANKALMAERGADLHERAEQSGVDLYYEAAVAGAIPLLRPLLDSLSGDAVSRVLGIVNGTTNYILTKMGEEGADYAAVLADAQALGYAEADPTADVEGLDAAAKAAILASLAFHTRVTLSEVYCEGISSVSADDIAAADDMGFVIKLLAIAEYDATDNSVSVRVHPTMVPENHPLASVREAFNAVFIEAEAAGDLMFYGQGAGGAPTASAVLGDLVTAARHKVLGSRGALASTYNQATVLPIEDAVTSYYVSLNVEDVPGVLARIAGVFANHGVSIAGVRQDGHGQNARLVVRTHSAREGAIRDTVAELEELDAVNEVVGLMRVLDTEG